MRRTTVIPLILFAIIASAVGVILSREDTPAPSSTDPAGSAVGESTMGDDPEPRDEDGDPAPDSTESSSTEPASTETPDPTPTPDRREPTEPIDTRIDLWQRQFRIEDRPRASWPPADERPWPDGALVVWITDVRVPGAVGTAWLDGFAELPAHRIASARAYLDASVRAAYVSHRFEQEAIDEGRAEGPFETLAGANDALDESGSRIHAVTSGGPFYVVDLAEIADSRLAFVLRSRTDQLARLFPGLKVGVHFEDDREE